MNKENINSIKETLKKELDNIENLDMLNNLKVEYLGKKGIITELTSSIKDIPNEDKREYGMLINELRTMFNDSYDTLYDKFNKEEINKKLKSEKIDINLPGTTIKVGSAHVLEKMTEEIEELFISMGYDVVEGPEVECDYYNFELLNLPKGHPARDAQDTFYITEDMLLRSQTSPVQIRTMLDNVNKTPIKIICPGKTYRRDDDDPSHSHQLEGLVVDENISLSDLKGTCDVLINKLFGKRKTRFRPSFYPFTEPSVEVDMECFNCNGKGCPICKNTSWITVGGAGVVHPNVLNNCGYDSEKYTGFAFGFGLERLAMIKYGITDIRLFYTPNDLRTLTQFGRIEGDKNVN